MFETTKKGVVGTLEFELKSHDYESDTLTK